MKATRIIRRVDDLGRVVMPKENRRTMRIREGDPLEIFTTENGVEFRKYCQFDIWSQDLQKYLKPIKDITGKQVCICDLDYAIEFVGIPNKRNALISEALRNRIQNRVMVVSDECIKAFEDSELYVSAGAPIIVNGDVIGMLMTVGTMRETYTINEMAIIDYTARLIKTQMEEV